MAFEPNPPQKPIPLHTKDPEMGFTHDETAPVYGDSGRMPAKERLKASWSKSPAAVRTQWKSGSGGKLRVIRHYLIWFLVGAVIGAVIGVIIGVAIRYS